MALCRLDTADGRAGLDRVLAEPHRVLLATDFDGVLAPIVDDPAAAWAEAGATDVLGRLAPSLGAVVVVTGRPVAEALRLGGFESAPGLDHLRILGQYGVEQWAAATGAATAPPAHPGIERARAAVVDLLVAQGLDGAHLEDKGRALGVHLRRLPAPEGAMERLQAPLSALAADHDLIVEPGKLVLELRAPGMDKGAALDALLAERELAEVTTVVYAGDDLGDLAAFDAVERFRGGDGDVAGLLIGVGGNPADDRHELMARADLVLDSPAALVGWLGQLADALAGGRV